MNDKSPSDQVLAVKDDSTERSIPTAWRQPFRDIVEAFIASDYRLENGVAGVAPVSPQTAAQIRDYLNSYGATLVALPEESWGSSTCLWYGDHWEALVDLWTQEEGSSDLVLQTKVTEANARFIIQVNLVYVP